MTRPNHEKSFDDSTMTMRMKASKGVVFLTSRILDPTGERYKRISEPRLGLITSEDPKTWETLDSKRASNRSGDRPWNRPIRPVEGATMMRAGLKSQDGPNMVRTSGLAVVLAASSLFATGFGTAALAQDYAVTTTPLGFTSISGNPTATQITFTDADEGEVDIPIPFDITFFGTTRTMGTSLRVATNGGVSFNLAFNPNNTVFGNNLSAVAVQGDSLFPGLDDMEVSSGGVFFEMIGTTPNRSFIVEYSMIPNFDPLGTTLLDTQVVFNESGTIEFRYSNSNFFEPGFVTVGIKSASGITRGFPDTNVGAPTPTENVLFSPVASTPDLSISSAPTLSPATFLSGDTITVATTVSNIGAANSGNFNVSVYLSLDSTIDSNDQLIGSFSGSQQVNSGATISLNQTFVVPTPNPAASGRVYFVGVIADPGMTTTDPDPSNNAFGRAVFLGVPPYLIQRPARATFSTIRGMAGTNVIASTPTGAASIDDVLFPHPSGSPFSFSFFGTMINASDPVDLNTNGWVDFFAQNSAASLAAGRTNLALPKMTEPFGILAPFWEDLILRASSDSAILDRVDGTAPNRVWTIEYSKIEIFTGLASGNLSFQILIEEATSTIRFRYDSASTIAGAVSANIVLENQTGSDGIDIAPPTGTTFSGIPTTDLTFIPQGNPNFTVDLSASNVSVTPTMTNASASISVTRSIMNSGSSTASNFQVTYVLSTDNSYSLNDRIIGTETIATLGAGQNNTATMSFAIPTMTPAASYFVGVIVNTNSANPVLESNFFNNTAGTAAAIQVAAPGKAQGDLNGDLSIDIADVMLCITAAISANPSSAANVLAADLNNDNVVNILDVQIEINRVLAAP